MRKDRTAETRSAKCASNVHSNLIKSERCRNQLCVCVYRVRFFVFASRIGFSHHTTHICYSRRIAASPTAFHYHLIY